MMIKINLLSANQDKKESLNLNNLSFGDKIRNSFSKIKNQNHDGYEEHSESESEINLSFLLLKILIVISGITALYLYEQDNIPKLQAVLEVHKQAYEEAKVYNGKAAGAVAEIKKMKENKLSIEKQIESIGGLSRVRLKYIKIFDVIQQNIPDKMWFTSIKTKGPVVELDGVAFSEVEISSYIDLLGKNIHFSDVTLVNSEDDSSFDSSGKRLKRFKINCTMEKD